jgi:threonine/homoserine/homoserine lactone efflux protein
MTQEAILTLALAVLALALKPGPGMMMVMSRTIAQGMKACYGFMVGFLFVTLIYLLIVLIGFQFGAVDLVFISILVKSLSAVYLIWMGVQGLQNIELQYNEFDRKGESFFDHVTAAMALTAANPYVIVFYAGILPTVINISTINLDDMLTVIGIVLGIEGGVVLLYCGVLTLFRKKIPISFLKILRIFSSVMIILIGLYIGYGAIGAADVLSVQ